MGNKADYYREKETCIYTPVCQAALNAVSGASGIAVGRYLLRNRTIVSHLRMATATTVQWKSGGLTPPRIIIIIMKLALAIA